MFDLQLAAVVWRCRLEPIGDLTPNQRGEQLQPPMKQLFDFTDLGNLFSVKATANGSTLRSLPVKEIDREQAAATAADRTQMTGVEAYRRFIKSARNRDHVRTMSYFAVLPESAVGPSLSAIAPPAAVLSAVGPAPAPTAASPLDPGLPSLLPSVAPGAHSQRATHGYFRLAGSAYA